MLYQRKKPSTSSWRWGRFHSPIYMLTQVGNTLMPTCKQISCNFICANFIKLLYRYSCSHLCKLLYRAVLNFDIRITLPHNKYVLSVLWLVRSTTIQVAPFSPKVFDLGRTVASHRHLEGITSVIQGHTVCYGVQFPIIAMDTPQITSLQYNSM